jgi:TRAP transporter TAXI family solute receptor
VTTTSSCFTSRRRTITAALLLLSVCSSACSSGAAAPRAQELTLLSGIAAGFTNDLVKRFNTALPQTHIQLQASSGGVAVGVVGRQRRGRAGAGAVRRHVSGLPRGIEKNLYPHKNLRAIAVLWINTFYVLVRGDSPFRSIRDLKGKHVGIIRPGTSGEFSTRIVLDAHGMSYADVVPIFEPTDTLMPMLAKGEIDAVFSANPLMLDTIHTLSQTVPLRCCRSAAPR